MKDPGLDQLERALGSYCDDVLMDLTVPVGPDAKMRSVRWIYRGSEFRASVVIAADSGHLSLPKYAEWQARGKRFDVLPSTPVFEWRRSDLPGWQAALDVAQWRRALRSAGGDGPDNLAGRPVRPRPRLPFLRAAAEAKSERVGKHSG